MANQEPGPMSNQLWMTLVFSVLYVLSETGKVLTARCKRDYCIGWRTDFEECLQEHDFPSRFLDQACVLDGKYFCAMF